MSRTRSFTATMICRLVGCASMTEASPTTPRTLSIVIPVYNERRYFLDVLARVEAAPLPPGSERRIVVVDDGSTDGTADLLRDLQQRRPDLKVILHGHNQGNGAALRTGFAAPDGDLVLVQDADFEYDPNE